MSFKQRLEDWLHGIKTKYEYSHIEKAFTHLFIKEFREDHELHEEDIRRHVVDNSYDMGVDALYVNQDQELILIQSKYSSNDSMLRPEIDKADHFLGRYFETNGTHDQLLLEANRALQTILEMEVFPETIREVRFIYLCGSFSVDISTALRNIEAKYQEQYNKPLVLELVDITALESLYDPYHVKNISNLSVVGGQYYEVPAQEVRIDGFQDTPIFTRACVFTGQALSLKNQYLKFGDALFESNVRNFLSFRKPINKAIRNEVNKARASNLWFYNNGLVAICEGYSYANGEISAKNLQIVNGGQTVRTIASVNYINESLGVNIKLISIENSNSLPADTRRNFINELAVNSNKQNPINSRDLKSNDEGQRELQNKFRNYGWFLEIKAGEEKIDPWKATFKKNGRFIRNTTLVGYYISFFLQKTNASAGRTSLAFLAADEGDDVINYETIFGSRGLFEYSFKKHMLSFAVAQKVEQFRRKENYLKAFPFLFYSQNIMLALLGYWIYLNENQDKRNINYVEDDIRNYLISSSDLFDKYISVGFEDKIIRLNYENNFDKVLIFFTKQIHAFLKQRGDEQQFRKIINLFKNDSIVKEFADTFRPSTVFEEDFFV